MPETWGQDINFTAEERAWILAHQVVTLAVDENNPPMNYRDEYGLMRGVHVEYMRALGEKLGVRIEFVGSDWSTALERAMEHEVDGIINASPTRDRRQFLAFTEPYFHTPDAIGTRRQTKSYEKAEDFADSTIAVIRDSIRADVFRDYSPDARIVEVRSVTEGFELVIQGRADGFLDELAVIRGFLQEYHLPNLRMNTVLFLQGSGATHLGLRNDDPLLLSVFNTAIRSLTDAEHKAIRGSHIPDDEAVAIQRDYRLTEREVAWIDSHPVIRVAADPAYAPIEFRDSDGRYAGLAIDYLEEIGSRLGIEFRFPEREEWAELVQRPEGVDVFTSLDSTVERSRRLSFTTPFVELPISIFAPESIRYVGSLAELEGRPVGAVRSYAETAWLKQDHPALDLHEYESVTDGLTALRRREIDAFVGNLVVTRHYLWDLGFHDIQVVGDTEYRIELSFGVRRDWPTLVSILNKALAETPESVTRAFYQQWIPLQPPQNVQYWPVVAVVGALLLALLGVLFWNRSLGTEISRRNEALAELELTQEQLVRTEKLASMGTLIAGIAHEINNPLNYVTSGIAALEKQLAEPDADADAATIGLLLQNIKTGAFRAADIVSGLREYSRMDSSEMTEVDVNESLRLAAAVLENEVDGSVELRMTEGEIPGIFGYRGKLDQVFVNLIMNALEAIRLLPAESTRRRGRIEIISSATEDGWVEVSVVDSGPGIPEEARSRLFDPFYTTKESGTGLGLSICQSIVESHGGTITVPPRQSGAEFLVRLPIPGETGGRRA